MLIKQTKKVLRQDIYLLHLSYDYIHREPVFHILLRLLFISGSNKRLAALLSI